MKHLEAAHQQQVIEWARMASKSQAGIAKAQGMLSGVPDLFLPVPKNGFHGLFIEMKSEKGRVTENQHWFLTNAESVGYKTAVCYSAKEAISALKSIQRLIRGVYVCISNLS